MSGRRSAVEALDAFGPQVAPFIDGYLAGWRPYKPAWSYEDGCIYKGLLDLAEALGDRACFDFVRREVASRVAPNGAIPGFDPQEYNIDNVNGGKALIRLLKQGGEPRLRRAIDAQHAQLETHPRTKSGNYWHKKIYPRQVWLDGLYMAQPFRCAYAALADRPGIRADVLAQFAAVEHFMRDPATGLYYHGWDESRAERWSDPATGCSPNFWGRSLGWYMMALVDCVELLAGDAEPLASQLRSLAHALLKIRGSAGLWWQVPDQPGRERNYEEVSASLMIAYALMKGARLGALPQASAVPGRDTLQAVIRRFLGVQALGGICGVAGLGGDPYRDGSYEYYVSEPLAANDPKGVGALLMALAEAVRRPDATS
ncbi:MAG TPA: glycoside hydrolase family 88 protein [Steroidobacteraceae bacterium]|nr:glycoside hydrolase family 88 protein [Steroidobacteraceae bacterium]